MKLVIESTGLDVVAEFGPDPDRSPLPGRLRVTLIDESNTWSIKLTNYTDVRALADFLSAAADRMQVVYERKMTK